MAVGNLENLQAEIRNQLGALQKKIAAMVKTAALPRKKDRFEEIEAIMQAPDFWNDQDRASKIQKERTSLQKEITGLERLTAHVADNLELIEMVAGEQSELLSLQSDVKAIRQEVSALELQRMLSGENDRNNAILSVNVGQGGVDSQDFTEMLLRMYKRYAERRGYTVELMEATSGEEAGLKSATILVSGDYAYGYLKAEIGVHRLVRISPFDSAARRHTSFSSVWVLPEIDDSKEIDIKTDELRIDTYRAGGAGGQHVNKTDSAVRITHLPTGTVVACQAERSQIKNRSTAMKLLKAKLYDLEMKKKLKDKDKAEAEKMEASFGSQIRNYVLAPYRLAKDLRSGYEVGNVDAVLDGEIQPFIEAYLLKQQTKD